MLLQALNLFNLFSLFEVRRTADCPLGLSAGELKVRAKSAGGT